MAKMEQFKMKLCHVKLAKLNIEGRKWEFSSKFKLMIKLHEFMR